MVTIENNILIADYLVKVSNNWQKDSNQGDGEQLYFQPHNTKHQQIYPSEMLFHTDWNWLIELVECIKSKYTHNNWVDNIDDYYFWVGMIDKAILTLKKESVYNICVEFIKCYNSNNETDKSQLTK